jgi:hypothetical protein
MSCHIFYVILSYAFLDVSCICIICVYYVVTCAIFSLFSLRFLLVVALDNILHTKVKAYF